MMTSETSENNFNWVLHHPMLSNANSIHQGDILRTSKLLYLEQLTDYNPKLNTAALNLLGPKKKQRKHWKLALVLILCKQRKVQLISEEGLLKGQITQLNVKCFLVNNFEVLCIC